MKKMYRKLIACMLVAMIIGLTGCGGTDKEEINDSPSVEAEDIVVEEVQVEEEKEDTKSITGLSESAKDAYVDFKALQEINPDIFAWMYVPGTDVDLPILFNVEDDSLYETRDVYKKESKLGAPYLDMHNYPDMCDFNTVIHGKMGKGDYFEAMSAYDDPTYFYDHPQMIMYLDGNVLTYTIVAAYRSEEVNLFKEYNFQSAAGCKAYVDEIYHNKFIGKSTREDFEGLNENNFLVTLLLDEADNSNSQLVIVAALVGDAANTIDRAPFDEENVFEGYDLEGLMQEFDFQVVE